MRRARIQVNEWSRVEGCVTRFANREFVRCGMQFSNRDVVSVSAQVPRRRPTSWGRLHARMCHSFQLSVGLEGQHLPENSTCQ